MLSVVPFSNRIVGDFCFTIYKDEDYASHKPCTTVYKLVEELNKPEEVIARLNRQSRP